MDAILDRECIANGIKSILRDFDTRHTSLTYKKGIYIYGSPGCGKTSFVNNLLKELDYDIIQYDAGDVRNKALIDTITCNNISNKNVLHMMHKKTKKIAIVMDEIDGMNNGDKGGITALIKLIRQKKTKKQRTENVTLNPIICIGNYYIDKKIKELMKVCNVFELKPITNLQVKLLLNELTPKGILSCDSDFFFQDKELYTKIINYIQGDLRKLYFIHNMIIKKPNLFHDRKLFDDILHLKSHHDDSKKITKMIINNDILIAEHTLSMNETERTIVALLYHENIVDPIFADTKTDNKIKYDYYAKFLENVCYADHIDRITFQNQIWIFNEMSSLIKTFYNNHLYHKTFPLQKNLYDPEEVRFTKVLTKYSTEYNNHTFIYNLCQELDLDKKDLISFFQEKRLLYKSDDFIIKIGSLLEETNITKLDIKRIYRYLDKNVKVEECIDEDDN